MRFQPQLTYTQNGQTVRLRYSTYAELKKRIKDAVRNSDDGEVFVSRTRRGEWGEWYEYWTLRKGKPKIDREGWM